LKVSTNIKIAMQCFENFGAGICPLLVARLVATYSGTDSVKFKDACFVETLFVTYSETDSVKFKVANL